MFLYGLLMIIGIVFMVLSILLVVLSCMCDDWTMVIALVISLVIMAGAMWGTYKIEERNTTIVSNTMQMDVVKMEIDEQKYYIAVQNDDDCFLIRVSAKEYVNYEVGDTVTVFVETKACSVTGSTKTTVAITEQCEERRN